MSSIARMETDHARGTNEALRVWQFDETGAQKSNKKNHFFSRITKIP